MSTADFLVKFNALDDDAKEAVIRIIDLLSPGKGKNSKKESKIRWTDKRLDTQTEAHILKTLEKIDSGDYTEFLTLEQIETEHGVSRG
ncbi:MAG: hypothetical protein JNJ47_07825 [Alphaproteobacteria bacterium]|nr:hypothetical protein [Alphaproteobacteria bacterium]